MKSRASLIWSLLPFELDHGNIYRSVFWFRFWMVATPGALMFVAFIATPRILAAIRGPVAVTPLLLTYEDGILRAVLGYAGALGVAFAFILVASIASVSGGLAFHRERRDDVLTLLLLTNVSPRDLVALKLVGAVTWCLSLISATMPYLILITMFLGTNWRSIATVLVWGALLTIVGCSIGVTSATFSRGEREVGFAILGSSLAFVALATFGVPGGLLSVNLGNLGGAIQEAYGRLPIVLLATAAILPALLFTAQTCLARYAHGGAFRAVTQPMTTRRSSPRSANNPVVWIASGMFRGVNAIEGPARLTRAIEFFLFALISSVPFFGTVITIVMLAAMSSTNVKRLRDMGALGDLATIPSTDREMGEGLLKALHRKTFPYLVLIAAGTILHPFGAFLLDFNVPLAIVEAAFVAPLIVPLFQTLLPWATWVGASPPAVLARFAKNRWIVPAAFILVYGAPLVDLVLAGGLVTEYVAAWVRALPHTALPALAIGWCAVQAGAWVVALGSARLLVSRIGSNIRRSNDDDGPMWGRVAAT